MEVFAGPLWVHYGQAYVLIGDSDIPDLQDAFRGQADQPEGRLQRSPIVTVRHDREPPFGAAGGRANAARAGRTSG